MNTYNDVERQLESDLALSIQSYKQILGQLEKINKEIGTASPDVIQELNAVLAELQEKVKPLDKSLQMQSNDCTMVTEAMKGLHEKRQYLLGEVLQVNKQIIEKAQGVQTFIVHEMERFHAGLVAMNGYKQHNQHQGRIVNSSL
ncbi:MAG: hypothetical protein P4L42_09595 [Desulfocapsaceae bacterium]|nr:hypothetical protein [Desulfocapsaceae bacterium]